MSQRTVGRSVGVHAHPFVEESVEVSKSVPQEHLSKRLYEQIVESVFSTSCRVACRSAQDLSIPDPILSALQVLEANDEACVKGILEGIM